MSHDEYQTYLLSPQWKHKRRQVLIRAGYKCERCGARQVELDQPLEVHHKTYEHLKREPLEDLEALCQACHEHADHERQVRAEERRYQARLAGWGRKVYGDNWDLVDNIEELFEIWLEERSFSGD